MLLHLLETRGSRAYPAGTPRVGNLESRLDSAGSNPLALVAQGIEQRFPKPRVGGSSPSGGTIF